MPGATTTDGPRGANSQDIADVIAQDDSDYLDDQADQLVREAQQR